MAAQRRSMLGSLTATAAAVVLVALPARVAADGADAVYSWQTPSKPWQPDQTGFNNCIQRWGPDNPTAMCNTLVVNSIEDFCIWGPPTVQTLANSERITVAYCLNSGYGTRLIPDGTFTSIHFVKTPTYVQLIGEGDFTKIMVANDDSGGELDPHGSDGFGNPEGGLVYSTAFGTDKNGNPKQAHQWMEFLSYNQVCIRVCDNNDAYNAAMCQHIYDVMGCEWVMPSNAYNNGGSFFDTCEGEDGEAPGVYGTSTWYQGDCGINCAPPPHQPPASSQCSNVPSPVNKIAPSAGATSGGSSTSGSSAPASSGSVSSGTMKTMTSTSGAGASAATRAAPSTAPSAISASTKGSSSGAAPGAAPLPALGAALAAAVGLGALLI